METIDEIQNQRLFKAMQLIRDGLRRNISVDKVCRGVGCSRPVLDNLFTECLGRTVSAEIIRLRLELVTEQLQGTDLSMEEISEMLYFPSRCQLSKFVKKWSGMTATEVRQGRSAVPAAPGFLSGDMASVRLGFKKSAGPFENRQAESALPISVSGVSGMEGVWRSA